MTEHLRPIPFLKEDRTVSVVGDFLSITQPTQDANVASPVVVSGQSGSSNSVSVTISYGASAVTA